MSRLVTRLFANGLLCAALAACVTAAAVVDGIASPDVPYADPQALVEIWESHPTHGTLLEVSYGAFAWWRQNARTLSALAHYQWTPATRLLEHEGRTSSSTVAATSLTFLQTLGVAMVAGRAPTESDLERDVIVLSERSLDVLGIDARIVGQEVRLDGTPFTVIGIAPRQLTFPGGADAYTFFSVPEEMGRRQRNQRYLKVVARLRSGTSRTDMEAELASLSKNLAREFPQNHAGWQAVVRPLVGKRDDALWRSAVAVAVPSGLTYALGLIGLSGVLIGESAARARDWAVRVALGAPPRRLFLQLCRNAATLTLPGAAAALGVSALLCAKLPGLVPFPEGAAPRLGLPVLGLWTILMLGAWFVSWAALAWPISWRSPARELAAESGLAGRGAGRVLVALQTSEVLQIAGAIPLLHLALGLQLGAERLAHAPLGFEASDRITADLPLTADLRAPVIAETLVDRLRADGVTAALSTSTPLRWPEVLWPVAGRGTKSAWSAVIATTSAFPEVLGIRLLAGRRFSPDDGKDRPPVALVSQQLARKLWGDAAAAVGQQVQQELDVEREVVGVLADIDSSARGERFVPTLYVPIGQWRHDLLQIVVPARDLPRATAGLREFGPGLTLRAAMPLEELVARRTTPLRMASTVSRSLSVANFALALLGVVGLASVAAGAATRVTAVRLALGALPERVLSEEMARVWRWPVSGTGLGLALAVAVGEAQAASTQTPVADLTWVSGTAIGFVLAALVATRASMRTLLEIQPADLLRET